MYIKNGNFKKYTHIISYMRAIPIQQPISNIVSENGTYTFSIKVKGSKPITYKWYRNNFPILNGNTNTLTLSNISLSDDADYYCKVMNGNNYLFESATVHLSVQSIPIILTQLLPTSIVVGQTDFISVSAVSNVNLKYKWYKDNYNIQNATTSAYHIMNASINDEGDYFVVISNDVASITSAIISLSVIND